MSEQIPSLFTFYSGWKGFHQNLVKVISPLSTEELTLKIGSHHWSIGTITQHIVGNRVWWFQVWMGQGDSELAHLADWDPQANVESPVPDTSELVAALESTWQMIEDALTNWTAADLDDVLPLPAALREDERHLFVDLTRNWAIWHVLEHEILHGGELSVALGMHGLTNIYEF